MTKQSHLSLYPEHAEGESEGIFLPYLVIPAKAGIHTLPAGAASSRYKIYVAATFRSPQKVGAYSYTPSYVETQNFASLHKYQFIVETPLMASLLVVHPIKLIPLL